MSRYLIVIGNAGANYSAYSPDLPGCVTTGKTLEETRATWRRPSSFTLRAFVRRVYQCHRRRPSVNIEVS